MKKGDVLICVKDFMLGNDIILFKNGNQYIVDNTYFVSDYKEHFGSFHIEGLIPSKWLSLKSEHESMDRHFSVEKMSQGLNYLWEYFNNKELLNIKLKKIRKYHYLTESTEKLKEIENFTKNM